MIEPDWNTMHPVNTDDVDDMMELDDVPAVETEPDHPDATLLTKPNRKSGAVGYERRIKKILGAITRAALQRPATVPDAATILQLGPKVAEHLGDLAAENEAVAQFLFVSEKITDNATLSAITAIAALGMQIVRNHEPILEPAPRSFVVPFLKHTFKLPKIGIQLGLFRAATHDPDVLVQHVFGDPKVIAALEKNGMTLVTGD